MKKVLLVTEILSPPYDEGIKKTVFNLYTNLNKSHNVKVIARKAFEDEHIEQVNTNALFISSHIKETIKSFNPDVIIYFPYASATFAAYLRHRVLSFYGNKAKTILLALQPKPLKKWQQFIVNFIKPKNALTPSPLLKEFWESKNIECKMLPLLTDLNTFTPISDKTSKQKLRAKYNLPQDAFIISHMGHLNEGRNLKSLIPLQKAGNQIVVVGSSSTPTDALGPATIKQELVAAGAIVLDGYIDKIQEIYQLSDIYIFPVVAKNGSIGMPLSIMEARACATPVVTTNFGSLKHYLGDDNNGIIYSDPENFLQAVNSIKNSVNNNYSNSTVASVNEQFFSIIRNEIDQ